MKKRRWYGAWGVLIAFVALAVWGWSWARHGPVVPVIPVVLGDVVLRIHEPGKTHLPEIYPIRMPFTGRLPAIPFREGDPVQEGQVLVELERFELENAVAEGKARFLRLQAAVRENDDARMEETGLKASDPVLQSMTRMVEAAQEKTKSSQARWEFGMIQLKRARELFQKDSASRSMLDAAELAHMENSAEQQSDLILWRAMQAIREAAGYLPVSLRQSIEKKALRRAVLLQEQAEADAQLARLVYDLDRATLKSPVSGVVLNRAVMGRQPLEANALILELGRLEDLEIETDLLTQDALNLHINAIVSIHGPGPSPLQGRVVRVFPRAFTKISSLGVEQQRVKVIIRPDASAITQLRTQGIMLGADYRVELAIPLAEARAVVSISRQAVYRDTQGRWHAWRLASDRLEDVVLEVGVLTSDQVEVRKGLAPGDLVVLTPSEDLEAGQRAVGEQVQVPPVSFDPQETL